MTDWGVLLRPTPRRLVEALLPGARTLTELATITGLRKPSLLTHLRALEDLGLVARREERTASGRETSYALRGGSLHLELRGPVVVSWAAAGPTDERFPLTSQIAQADARLEVAALLGGIDRALGGLGQAGVVAVILFGSLARGQATWKSDIDLLFVIEEEPTLHEARVEALKEALAAEQPNVARAVRPFFATDKDLIAGRRTIEREAREDGIIVHARPGERRPWEQLTRYGRIWI